MAKRNGRMQGARRSTDPYVDAVPLDVSAADQVLAVSSRGVYVGGTGDLVVELVEGSASVTFKAVPAGAELHIAVKRVIKAGTTVTDSLLLL